MRQDVSTNNSTLEHASRLRTRDRIVALGQALQHAAGPECDTLACMLIELAGHHTNDEQVNQPGGQAAGPVELLTRLPNRWRTRHADDALLALARAWSNLSPNTRPLAVALGRDRWLSAAAELASAPDPESRLAALAIAHDTADPGLGQVVTSLLSDEQQSVRRAADQTLLRLALQLLDHLPVNLLGESFAKIARTPRTPLPADPVVLDLERCTLFGAVADAAWSFASHRCRSPLLAALLLMDRAVATPLEREIGARMRRLLAERNHPSHAPLRSVLKRTDCPILRERALRWLCIPAMSNAALDRLRIAESLIEHEIVLRQSCLLLRPCRATQLASISRLRSQQSTQIMYPARSAWNSLSEHARIGLLQMTAVSREDEHTRRAICEPALADPSVRVRLHMAALCSTLDLSDLIYDPSSSIARHAVLRWSTLGVEPPKIGSAVSNARAQLAALNTRSPHAWVRRVASEEHTRLAALDPHQPAARHRARRLMHTDPALFARIMRDRLASPATRNDAVVLIRMLGVERRFELDLIGIIQGEVGDERARASAVVALGRVGTKAAHYTLAEAVRDHDPRTRSNAVEAIDFQAEQVIEFKDDPHHRVRASALRRVLSESAHAPGEHARSACSAMIEMLHDDRTPHRLAGVWAAQRTVVTQHRAALGTSWAPIITRLESLAANDLDPQLRTRATRCIARLTHELGSQRQSQQSNDGAWEV